MNKILKLPEVINITSRSKSSIYQGMADGSFPKQISLGERSVGWLENQIESWIDERISESKGGTSS